MRALVIGIDSASPFLITKWMDDLPNLASIFSTGAGGVLQSIVPPESVPAWQCFATGKNPAKIGNYGFSYISKDLQLKHGKTTAEMGCFWDICSREGMKVGVFNVPGTFPPYPLNGFMISGFPVPTRKVWAFPETLMKRLDKAVNGYDIDVPLTKPTEMKGGEKSYLPMVERLHRKTLDAAKYLIGWYRPDVFMMTFQGIDLVHHDFWRYMGEPASPYSNVLHDWYVRMDEAVGELRALAGPGVNVLVMSDHGSAPVSSALFINRLLEDNGLLRVKGPVKHKGDIYTRLRRFILKNLPPGTITSIYKITPNFVAHRLTASAAIERTLTGLIENVDWNNTLAFSTGGHQCHFYVNETVARRLANGSSSATSDVVRKICDLMSQLVDPRTGEKLRPIFHFKEETFKGPFQDEAPDLCVELFSGNEKVQINPRIGAEKLWSSSPHFSSIHTRDGFWGMAGPGIRRVGRMNAYLLDLAPTLLALLGIRVSTDFDGVALREILAEDSEQDVGAGDVQREALASRLAGPKN